MKKQRGQPVITLRLDPGTIAALKMSATRHGLTVSELIRQLIADQLQQDGICPSSAPLDGQLTM